MKSLLASKILCLGCQEFTVTKKQLSRIRIRLFAIIYAISIYTYYWNTKTICSGLVKLLCIVSYTRMQFTHVFHVFKWQCFLRCHHLFHSCFHLFCLLGSNFRSLAGCKSLVKSYIGLRPPQRGRPLAQMAESDERSAVPEKRKKIIGCLPYVTFLVLLDKR